MERVQKPKKATDIVRGAAQAVLENTTGYMKRAKPPANTMIAEHANKISCISRRSRLRDGIPSKKRIATSYVQSYSARKRESGSGRRSMHKQVLLLFRIIKLTLPNLKKIDGIIVWPGSQNRNPALFHCRTKLARNRAV